MSHGGGGSGTESEARPLGEWQKDTVEAWEEQRRKPWQLYVDAELGLRNHWYPAFYSHELEEADVSPATGEAVKSSKTVTLLGEPILFRRIDGVVHAVQDWCLHRGVPFSVRPECYTKETLTCWYHGFTYDMRDGALTSVLTDPGCPLVGKVKLRTYPVQERKGFVWVFIGDSEPHDLALDVPPGFLDEGLWFYPHGWTRDVACNWRPAAENGFDPAHAYLHRNSDLTKNFKIAFPIGETGLSKSRGMEVVEDGPGPHGVKLLRGGATSVWEGEVDGVKVGTRYRPGDPGVLKTELPEVSIWMPSILKVDPFPVPGILHFELYVPIDERNHRYMITWAKYVKDEEDRAAFEAEIRDTWAQAIPNDFSSEDVFAREALDGFYAKEEGWYRERLFGPDVVITSWRNLVSRKNRGIQQRGLQ